MKKLLSVLLCAVMVLSLAACGKKENAPTPGPDPNGETEGLTVALVVAGKLGDRSFYDSSKEGLDRMVADLGVTPIVIECNNENHDIQMKNAAEKANIVVCVGWEFYNVETIAPDYPEVNWIWVDNATSAPVSNVLNITYAQNEGSFLAGYIAAAVSETGRGRCGRRRGCRHHQRLHRRLHAGRGVLRHGERQGRERREELRRHL